MLVVHAALVALTPLIPLPFVDDLAKNRLQRRMVRTLAERRAVFLERGAVEAIADDESAIFRGLGRSIALLPIRFLLRRLLVVLRGKAIVDLASRTYHRGFLIDAVFAHGFHQPGRASPRAIRRAIDAVLAEQPLAASPVTHAIREGLTRSGRSLAAVYERLRKPTSNVDAAIDAAAESLADGVEPLREAVDEVPPAHFEALERALLERLATRK